MGMMAVAVGTTLYGAVGIFTRLSMSGEGKDQVPYDTNAALLVTELCKLVVTAILLVWSDGLQSAVRSISAVPPREWLLFSAPAVIYSITNNLSIMQLKYMDPGTNSVLVQSKIITTALLWWFWFKNPIDKQQWVSLGLLMAGSMFVALPNEDSGSTTMYIRWPTGPLLVLAMVVLSALAGIITEGVYKTFGRNRSIHIDNLSMYIWGIASNALQFYYIGQHDLGTPLIAGFNGWTWAMVAVSVSLGLTLGYVMKYFDNIVKLLMNGASIIVSGVLSYLVFGFRWTLNYCIGSLVVVFAVLLFKSKTKYIR